MLREVDVLGDDVLDPTKPATATMIPPSLWPTSRSSARSRVRAQAGGEEERRKERAGAGRPGITTVPYVPAAAGEVAEAVGRREHDERDVDVAEDGELVGLLDEAVAALGEGDLPVGGVLDPLDLQLHAPHGRRRRVAEAVGGGSGEPASEAREDEAAGGYAYARAGVGRSVAFGGRRREFVGRG